MTDNNKTKLLLKLRALVAVIKVALEKIVRAREEHGTSDRLDKVENNLINTLSICARAMKTIQELPTLGRQATPSGAREYVEMATVDEYRKFQQLPPITLDEVADVDIDALLTRFGGE